MSIDNYSVLMSVYYKDNPKWLEQSIKSMMNQTVITDDFVIIKDGKLTKELNNAINKYCKKYPNIFNIIQLEENQGLGPALAIGIKKCKNALVARMDADDISLKERCEKQLKQFHENKELDILGTNIAEFIDDIKNIKMYKILPEKDEEIKKYVKRRNPFSHPSIMLKKDKVLEAGNYRSYYLCEDYDMWIRMIERDFKCYNIQETLVYMRIGEEFYKRRGGKKYFKSIYKLKTEQYKKRFCGKKDYIISIVIHAIICFMPNKIRKLFYEKALRSEKGV